MSPLTIFLAKVPRAVLHHCGAGDDDAQAKRGRNRQGINREPATSIVRRSTRPCRWPRHDHWSQYLVGGRVARRRHSGPVADGDPGGRAARLVSQCDHEALRSLALRTAFLFLYGRNAGSRSLPGLCGFQRVTMRASMALVECTMSDVLPRSGNSRADAAYI